MPRSDSYSQGVSYPVLGDAADIELAMSTLVGGIVPRLVMRFADANARAAALTGATKPVPGMITYLVAEDRFDGRMGDGTWLPLSDGAWKPLTFASGYTAIAGSPGWRYKAGGGIELRGRIKRTTNGNLSDDVETKFASIPASVAPGSTRSFITATSRQTINNVSHYTARVTVATDGDLTYNCEAGGGTGTTANPPWFSLDGIQFSPAGD
jgi:hypothetical protein